MKLVENAGKLHKAYSVIAAAGVTGISLAEGVLPLMTNIQPMMEPSHYGVAMFILGIAVLIGRYIKQDNVEGKEKKNG